MKEVKVEQVVMLVLRIFNAGPVLRVAKTAQAGAHIAAMRSCLVLTLLYTTCFPPPCEPVNVCFHTSEHYCHS